MFDPRSDVQSEGSPKYGVPRFYYNIPQASVNPHLVQLSTDDILMSLK